MEISFPLEFIVPGRAVSLQAKRPEALAEWKRRVRAASNAVLPDSHYCSDDRLAVTLFYFPSVSMQGDLDNIIKPILDALCRHVYYDDSQVERIWVQKFAPEHVSPFASPTSTLARAIEAEKPLIYVRVSLDLLEGMV